MGWQMMLVDVEGMRVLVVGGGSVGARRALRLAGLGAKVLVASLDFDESLLDAERSGLVELVRLDASRPWELAPLIEWSQLVVVALPSRGLAEQVASLARERGKLVSVATTGLRGNVVMPLQGEAGGLIVGVTSLGESGLAARRLLEECLREAESREVQCIRRAHGEAKRRMIESIPDPKRRMEAHMSIWRDGVFRTLCREGRVDEALRRALEVAGLAGGGSEPQ